MGNIDLFAQPRGGCSNVIQYQRAGTTGLGFCQAFLKAPWLLPYAMHRGAVPDSPVRVFLHLSSIVDGTFAQPPPYTDPPSLSDHA